MCLMKGAKFTPRSRVRFEIDRPKMLFSFVILLTNFYRGATSTTELSDSFYSRVEETSSELMAITGTVLFQSDIKVRVHS